MRTRRNLMIGGGGLLLAGAAATWLGLRDMGSMQDYTAAVTALRAALPARPKAADLIRFATLAANSHNTQAWTFHAEARSITLAPDRTRATPVVDPDDHHLFVSLGCAAENLSIAAASRGLPGRLQFYARGGGVVRFSYADGAAVDTDLSDVIALRQSTRGMYDGSTLTSAELDRLAMAARLPGVDLILMTDHGQMAKLADLIAAANTAQIADPAFMAELKHWMRFNPRDAINAGDGLFSATTGNPVMPDWLGQMMLDWAYTSKSENTSNAAKIASSAGLAVFVAAKQDAEHWVKVGRACQRFALQATAMGLKHAFLNQPVEVAALRPALASLIGLPGRRPDLVMRFGRGAAMPYAARRPVSAVMV
ncbi:Acg family FMN-binding oxidoreductase [Cypionkella sinensis]|uniref:Acg family FMN-binding oxidoreductase n=1 Tax=Cypionkella sinensis TaxID=1756043 RepID=A0ABV7J043_9RHOB